MPNLLVKTSSLGDVIHRLPVVSQTRRHGPADLFHGLRPVLG
jgi:ADP-heptose:LPS heptosyltransferase